MIESVKCKAHSYEAREKAKQTSLNLYGVDNVLRLDKNKQRAIKAAHTPEVEAKRAESIKKSNLEKYGVECSFQIDEVKQLSRKTMLNLYGVEFSSQFEPFKIKNKAM